MVPSTLTVISIYSDIFIYHDLEKPVVLNFTTAPAVVSYPAFYGLDQGILHSQSGTRNLIGDSITTIFTDQNKQVTALSYPELWVAFLSYF